MSGILYVLSTPIGDPDDITLRALRVLSEADAVVCEERRIGSTLLAHFKIAKPLLELNEHTEEDDVAGIVARMTQGESLALICDHGTPLVADPGALLVNSALRAGIRVSPVPGASSVISALVSSGLPANRFRFVGQLPPKAEMRRRALREFKDSKETLILLDAPYRLSPLLKSVQEELGDWRLTVVACNLTMPDESIVRGTLSQVRGAFELEPFKGEFICIIQGRRSDNHRHQRTSSSRPQF
jgi:16S rRNA (cytidine1402-2'-O)-methyltransferase